nr:hypothetical protein [Phocid alphaherpesvirus 1]
MLLGVSFSNVSRSPLYDSKLLSFLNHNSNGGYVIFSFVEILQLICNGLK